MEWLTTTTILDRLRDSSDDSAWSGFLERFRLPITRFCLNQGLEPADAEDVAQETLLAFLESYRKDSYDRGRGRLSQYLFGIAYNRILRMRRKIATGEVQIGRARDGTSFWATVPDEASLHGAWEQEWREAVLTQCLDRVRSEVSPQTFEAFRLMVIEQMNPADVAERLGVTRNAVFIAKHRVGTRMRALRAAIEEDP